MSQSNSQTGSRNVSRQSSRRGSVHSEHEIIDDGNSGRGEYSHTPPEDYNEMLNAMQEDPLGQVLFELIDSTNELAATRKGKEAAKPLTINIYDIAEKLARANRLKHEREEEHQKIVDALKNELEVLSLTTADQQAKTMALECQAQNAKAQDSAAELYNNPMFVSAVRPPTDFPTTVTLKNTKDLVEAYKLCPKGNSRFSGERNSPITANEFMKSMNEVQDFMKMTEQEFKKRLLGSTTGRAHELLSYWIEQDYSVPQIYYQLHLNFNKQDTPFAALTKLRSFKAYKNKGSAETESTIAQLALKAAQTIPFGPGRNSYFDHLCANTYIDCLPKESARFVRRRYNDLAVKLQRQPTFSELSQSLDAHRMELDADLSQNGIAPKGKEKEKENSKSSSKKGANTKFVNMVHSERDGEKNAGKGKFAQKNNQKVHSKGQKNFKKDGHEDRGKKKQYNKENKDGKQAEKYTEKKMISFPAPQKKPFKSDKYCSLCGNNTHIASDGCFKMRDKEGNILEVTPCFGDCTLCNKGLKHPEELCPYVALVQAEGCENAD